MYETIVRPPLPACYETDHFVFHYGHRSPFCPSGVLRRNLPLAPRCHGIHHLADVEKQAQFFEQAWNAYQASGWDFRPPLGYSRKDKCHVYVYRLPGSADGITGVVGTEGKLSAWIGVRCDWCEPTCVFTHKSAEATAAHELFHAVQFSYRLPSGDNDPWAWWYEATATYMEEVVFRRNDDNMRYMRMWLDKCDTPLDADDGLREYGSAIFCAFLVKLCGSDIIRWIWERCDKFRTPLYAIDAYLKNNLHLPFASAQKRDFFSSRFAVSNFLLGDPILGHENGRQYAPAFQHAFLSGLIDPASRRKREGILDHLAAEYYFLYPHKGRSSQLYVSLNVPNMGTATIPIKGVLVPLDLSGHPLKPMEIKLRYDTRRGNFRGENGILRFSRTQGRGALLVVVNCSWGDVQVDGIPYVIKVHFR